MKVAFLDRDGVINVDRRYVHRIADFEYLPKVKAGMRLLLAHGFNIIIITNQSGIARGLYTQGDFETLTNWMLSDLKESGITLLDVFHCPHHIDGVVPGLSIQCSDRKPECGMILRAAAKYPINLKDSILIGDQWSDVVAGRRAGITQNYLVEQQNSQFPEGLAVPYHCEASLFDAANKIVNL